jgi:hypothetical protein
MLKPAQVDGEVHTEAPRKAPQGLRVGDTTMIAGVRYRVIYAEWGDYHRTDGKGVIEGIGFVGVVKA